MPVESSSDFIWTILPRIIYSPSYSYFIHFHSLPKSIANSRVIDETYSSFRASLARSPQQRSQTFLTGSVGDFIDDEFHGAASLCRRNVSRDRVNKEIVTSGRLPINRRCLIMCSGCPAVGIFFFFFLFVEVLLSLGENRERENCDRRIPGFKLILDAIEKDVLFAGK